MPKPVSAIDIYVATIYQAHCKVCGWASEPSGAYSEAKDAKAAHLKDHRELLILNPGFGGGDD